MTDTLTIHHEHRAPIHATRHFDELIVRVGRSFLQLTADDLHQLYAYAADRPTIQRFPMAPKTAFVEAEFGIAVSLDRLYDS